MLCVSFGFSFFFFFQAEDGIRDRTVTGVQTCALPISEDVAPDTGVRYNIFGEGGGRRLSDEYGVPFLGAVPLGIQVREGGDKGVPVRSEERRVGKGCRVGGAWGQEK